MRLLELISVLRPQPQIIYGKYVINLLDPKAPHKGHALKKILHQAHFEYALYIGDDETDEKVFSIGDKNILSVVIGKKSDSKASFYLERQSNINRVLHLLLENLRHQSPRSSKKPRPKKT
jgi:trehalose-6-phosphatase